MACRLVQCWNIVNWTLRNKLQWNLNRNSYIFIRENAFKNVVWKKVAILSRPQCVKGLEPVLEGWSQCTRARAKHSNVAAVRPRDCAYCSHKSDWPVLTHWGRDKMAAVSQTTLSIAFSWKKMSELRLRFHWSLFLGSQLTIIQHWFR